MISHSHTEIVEAFKLAIHDAGIFAPDVIYADGQLHRFHIQDHKSGSLNGAYILHADGIAAGYFEDFTQGIKAKWKIDGNHFRLSDADWQQIKAARLARQKEFEARRIEAASKARYIWQNANIAINHPYLRRKQIQPHNARINKHGALTIPMFNAQLELVNLQFIDAEGNKRFLSGGQKKGCFYWLGKPTETLLIAEGFATAGSLRENAGLQTFVAFDAGNLETVAKLIRTKRPTADIIIAGDNDKSGVRQLAAKNAALAVRGRVSLPPQVGCDWNDYLTKEA